jgi:zinc metalloprotease ZmpB
MQTTYNSRLKAHISSDDGQKVRHIRHSQEYWLAEETAPLRAAGEYLRAMADALEIPHEQLSALHKPAQDLVPREQGIQYRFGEEKRQFDGSTIGYVQTYLDVPVFRRGLSVQAKQAPTRIVSVTDNSESNLDGKLPSEDAIARYRKLFAGARPSRAVGDEEGPSGQEQTILREIFAASARVATARDDNARLLRGRFVVYKYEPSQRYGGHRAPPERKSEEPASLEEEAPPPFIELPPVSDDVRPGRAYLAAELTTRFDLPGYTGLVWLALVEVESGSVLYLECLTQGVNGMVFKRDPMVATGDLTITSDDSEAILSAHDFDEPLNALDPASGGTQSLIGDFVVIQNEENPAIAPPTRPAGSDFDSFPVRSNDFAAVNAYYHMTELFRTIEDLGFVIADYFDGTTFPIPVDHRGMDTLGNTVNAHWAPNGSDGTDHMCFALCDITNIAQPLGRAVDPWVHWHEMGGHGTLGDHVGQGTFGFCHSAGDGLAALQMDPESALRGVPERFRYAPFRPFTIERRFDRPVPAWAWGGPEDDGDTSPYKYGAEQILATCHFRVYRSIGGDHNNVNRRKFASRAMTYLILRAIGDLTSATNPSNWNPATSSNVPGRGAQLWCERLQATDLANWTSEGISGGAYSKVIRWSFEEQGTYGGSPPAVDVYIDDGRHGEYPFQAVHWHNASMWNRNDADDLPGHQNAIAGATNHMYVKVKNRGTTAAGTVNVKAYHCLPGAGLTWPVDFTSMGPATGLSVAAIDANNSEEVTLGPFEWIPNENVYGHDCVLMIASTAGDASNVDNFTGAETIEEWRLVPNDNNVGQRNVTIEPGAGGGEALFAALDGALFVAGNSFNRPTQMELKVKLPRVLVEKGWDLDLGASARPFRLRPGAKRHVRLKLVRGADFTPEEIRAAADLDIDVDLYGNDMPLGGMTYRIDPNLKAHTGGERPSSRCTDAARDLLDCLDVSSCGGDVKSVRVKRVSLDIDLGGADCC